ncbi:hypothetical protein [Gracilibacillus alcaliphilus]|uniref:hypothetical protein n=1 Tax=Gracilibacillus alcaliphilus TaxID=1401441 RepID=UPI00195C993D|nr:hypothetical protein [Gracilibacillus alcaliphilus]MBM7678132.1 hypothetical protein [Gracilibacillus alcaliphilus]
MLNMEWLEGPHGTEFYLDGKKLGTAVSDKQAADSFVLVEDGVVCWTRRTATKVNSMVMRFEADYVADYQLIPALQYDGNQCYVEDFIDVRNAAVGNKKLEKKHEPTYFVGNKEPSSDKPWRFGWHRMSVPGATYSEGENVSVAMFLPKGQRDGACSLYMKEGKTIHDMLWPEQDGPLPVITGGQRVEDFCKPIETRFIFQVMLVLSPIEQPRYQWCKLLKTAWKHDYTRQPPVRSYQNLWDIGIAYAKSLYTEEEDGFCGFSIGYTWKNGEWIKREKQKYEIGWCGQNASLANSLLVHAQMNGDKNAAEMGIRVLDAWIAAARPNGLIPTHYDDNIYTNGFDKTIDACNLGTAAIQFFEAEQLAFSLGYKRTAYGEMARKICDFTLQMMNEEGFIAKSWLESDLSPAMEKGSTGSFLMLALCEGARLTNNQDYLAAAKRSYLYYMNELMSNGYTTGGALDNLTIDKESSIPLLKSSLILYQITLDPQYLVFGEHAAWYLSTWQWHYSKPFPSDSLLGQLAYDTFGGTAVSIHGGMDPYALFYVHELYDLGEYTQHTQWLERAHAIWVHGQLGISDGNLRLDGKAPRPVGSQDESVNYTYGSTENRPTQWLVAWPTAFRLEVLRKILPKGSVFADRIL